MEEEQKLKKEEERKKKDEERKKADEERRKKQEEYQRTNHLNRIATGFESLRTIADIQVPSCFCTDSMIFHSSDQEARPVEEGPLRSRSKVLRWLDVL